MMRYGEKCKVILSEMVREKLGVACLLTSHSGMVFG